MKWRLTLCVNLTTLLGAQKCGQMLFWMCLGRCSCNIWIGKLIKQTALPKVGGPHSVSWRAKRTKRLTLPWVKRNSSCPTASELGHQFFSHLQTQTEETSVFLRLEPVGLWTKTTPSALLGLQLADQTDPGTFVRLHNPVSQFLIVNIYLFTSSSASLAMSN